MSEGVLKCSHCGMEFEANPFAKVCPVCGGSIVELQEVEVWYQKGKRLESEGKIKEAISTFDKALELLAHPKIWYTKGNALRSLKRYPEAIEAYDQALILRPTFYSALLNKGNTYSSLDQYEKSLATYDELLELTQSKDSVSSVHDEGFEPPAEMQARAWFNKAMIFVNLSRLSEAIIAFDKVVLLRPKDVTAWLNKGITHHDLSDPVQALAAYDQALTLAPEDEDALFNRAIVLDELGKVHQALEAFDMVIILTSNLEGVAWFMKGHIYRRLEKNEQAIHAYDEVLRLLPDSPAAWLEKSMAFTALNNLKAAIIALKRAIRLGNTPSSELSRRLVTPEPRSSIIAKAWSNLGSILSEQNQYKKAIAALDEAIAINPTYTKPWYFKGLTLTRQNKFSEAFEAYTEADRLFRKNPKEEALGQEIQRDLSFLMDKQ